MLNDPRTLLGLLAAAVVSVAAVPFLLRADDPELALRRRRIEDMSQAQRERLERNYNRFEGMDEAARRQMRDFSDALEADRLQNHGRINQTLRIYADWLQTVTASQRDDLQREMDPVRRLVLIRGIVDSQRDERIEGRMGGRTEEFLGPIPEISRTDLEAMLAVVDAKAPLFLANRAELEEYTGIRRSLKLFELLAAGGKSVRDVLNDTTSRQLIEAVADEQTRRELETLPDRNRPMSASMARRMKLGLAIYRAIEADLDREHRGRQISSRNLNAFFEKLPVEEQDELLTHTPDRFRQQLLTRYVETEWSKNRINLTLVRTFFRSQRGAFDRPLPDPRRRDPRDERPR